jgi:phasin
MLQRSIFSVNVVFIKDTQPQQLGGFCPVSLHDCAKGYRAMTTNKLTINVKAQEKVIEAASAPLEAAAAAINSTNLIDMTEALRLMAEKGVSQAREAYESIKSFADGTTDALEDAYSVASKSFSSVQGKLIEIGRANSSSLFDYLEAASKASTVSEAIDLNSSFISKQLEVQRAQWNEVSQIFNTLATQSFQPLQDSFVKGLKRSA